jgi:hypothetical protein
MDRFWLTVAATATAAVLAAVIIAGLRQIWQTGILLARLSARMDTAERRLDRAESRQDAMTARERHRR